MLFVQRLEQREKRFLVHRLHGARDVLVFLLERLIRLPWRAEKIDKVIPVKRSHFRRAILPGVRNVIGVVTKIFEVQPESSIGSNPNDLAQLFEESRLAIRRQAHHFVFVSVMRETDELGERGIKNAERVRKINAIVDLDFVAVAESERGAGKVAEAVDGKTGRLVESGNKKRGGKMCEVMFDVMDLRFELEAVRLLERFFNRGGAANVFDLLAHQLRMRLMGEDKTEPSPIVHARVAIHRDVIDLA